MAIIALSSRQKEDKENPPNFVVFIADDISLNDFGCYDNKKKEKYPEKAKILMKLTNQGLFLPYI